MFRFYYRAHELAIQRAAQEDDWAKVKVLYKIDPRKDYAELDDAICDGVMNKVLFGKLDYDQTLNYLLRAFTLVPGIIKFELMKRLLEIPAFAELQHNSELITHLLKTSADIYTVMLMKKYNYAQALRHVNEDKEIPSIAPFVDLIKGSPFTLKK